MQNSFYKYMDEVCAVNPSMKNPPLNVGVISAPNEHPRVVLYDNNEVRSNLRQINQDIYVQRKKAGKDSHKKKFPLSVIILSLAGLAIGAFAIVKHYVKK